MSDTLPNKPKKPLPAKKAGKSKDKPAKQVNLTYQEAIIVLAPEMIPSRSKYDEWWLKNKPAQLPRFPYRAYAKDWVSWNDFLGNNNTFTAKSAHKWRPFGEALKYTATLKIPTFEKWLEYARQDPPMLPSDIPSRPDLVYKNHWRSWGHWLGTLNELPAIVRTRQLARSQVYYILHDPDRPQNVLKFGIEANGLTAIKRRWERDKFEIVRLYWVDDTNTDLVKQIVDMYSMPYHGDDHERIAPNVWMIISGIERVASQVTPADAKLAESSTSLSNDPLQII